MNSVFFVKESKLYFFLDNPELVRVRLELFLGRSMIGSQDPLTFQGEELLGRSHEVWVNGTPIAWQSMISELSPGSNRHLLTIPEAPDELLFACETHHNPTANTFPSGLFATENGLFLNSENACFEKLVWTMNEGGLDTPFRSDAWRCEIEAPREAYAHLITQGSLTDLQHDKKMQSVCFIDTQAHSSSSIRLAAMNLQSERMEFQLSTGAESYLELWAPTSELLKLTPLLSWLTDLLIWEEEHHGLSFEIPLYHLVITKDLPTTKNPLQTSVSFLNQADAVASLSFFEELRQDSSLVLNEKAPEVSLLPNVFLEAYFSTRPPSLRLSFEMWIRHRRQAAQ